MEVISSRYLAIAPAINSNKEEAININVNSEVQVIIHKEFLRKHTVNRLQKQICCCKQCFTNASPATEDAQGGIRRNFPTKAISGGYDGGGRVVNGSDEVCILYCDRHDERSSKTLSP